MENRTADKFSSTVIIVVSVIPSPVCYCSLFLSVILQTINKREKGVISYRILFMPRIKNLCITIESGYNDIGLSPVSCIASDILWYQLIPCC
jgi:hypothetical protein